MKLHEALETGKRIRRNIHNEWYTACELSMWDRTNILADDWEVEECNPDIRDGVMRFPDEPPYPPIEGCNCNYCKKEKDNGTYTIGNFIKRLFKEDT